MLHVLYHDFMVFYGIAICVTPEFIFVSCRRGDTQPVPNHVLHMLDWRVVGGTF